MAAERVVQELAVSVDQAGFDAWERGMAKAEAANAKLVAGVNGAQAAVDKMTVSMTQGVGRAASQWGRVVGIIDPVAKAVQQLERAQRSANAALATGAVTQQEVNATLASYSQRIAAARLAAGQAASGTQALGAASQRAGVFVGSAATATQNLSFQMQDLSQALFTGQLGFRTIVQQGSQIVQIFQGGTGIAAAAREVGKGLVAFVTNPLNLAVIGFAAAVAGAQALFSFLTSKGPDAADVLTTHKDLVDQIAGAYDGASDAAKRYIGESSKVLAFKLKDDIANLKAAVDDALRSLDKSLPGFGGASPIARAAGAMQAREALGPYAAAVEQMRAAMKSGVLPDMRAFRDTIADIADSQADQKVKALGRSIIDTAEKLADLQGKLKGSEEIWRTIFTPPSLDRPRDMLSPDLRRRADEAAAKVAKDAADANREWEKSIDERERARRAAVTGAQTEIDLVGLSIREQTRLRETYALTATAEEAAAKANKELSAKERADIAATADAAADLADKLAKVKIANDLGFERGLIGLSDQDVEIATKLRGVYDSIGEALKSPEANLIRINDRLKEAANLSKSMEDALESAFASAFTGPVTDLASFLAKSSMAANDNDAAQERGEAKANGGDRTVPKENSAPSAADLGLSRKDIHEARRLGRVA